eukprot:2795904-Prorocentrum_lima.AAC.2
MSITRWTHPMNINIECMWSSGLGDGVGHSYKPMGLQGPHQICGGWRQIAVAPTPTGNWRRSEVFGAQVRGVWAEVVPGRGEETIPSSILPLPLRWPQRRVEGHLVESAGASPGPIGWVAGLAPDTQILGWA